MKVYVEKVGSNPVSFSGVTRIDFSIDRNYSFVFDSESSLFAAKSTLADFGVLSWSNLAINPSLFVDRLHGVSYAVVEG